MLVVDFVSGIDRWEEVVCAIVAVHFALLIVAGV